MLLLAVVVAVAGAASAVAQSARPARPIGYVSDETGALRRDTVDELERELADYEARSGHEVAVAVVRTTADEAIEDYARALFDEWEVGQAERNDGVLLLVAVDDRRLRLQTGTGVESAITPEVGQHIVDNEIIPRLRSGDLDGGVRAGVIGVRRVLGDDVTTADQVVPEPQRFPAPRLDSPAYDEVRPFGRDVDSPGADLGPLVAMVVGIGFVVTVVQMIARGGRARTAGFGGFGSDRCPSCGATMSYSGRTVGGGERMSEYTCPTCGFEDRRVRGGGLGAGTLFGSSWLGRGADGDDRGFWGSGPSRSSSSSGSSWSGSSGSSGSSSSAGVGGGGRSSGGGASGSW